MHDGAAGGAAAMALIEVDEWLAVCALKVRAHRTRVLCDWRLEAGDVLEGVTGCGSCPSSRMRAKCEEKEPWRLPGRGERDARGSAQPTGRHCPAAGQALAETEASRPNRPMPR